MGRVLERWLFADADRAQVANAVRATLGTAITAAVLFAAHVPPKPALLGAAVAMMASLALREPTRRGQALTILAMAPAALAGLAAGVALGAHPPWGRVAVVVVVALSIGLLWFGPRGGAAGRLGFQAYFFAIFFQASLGDLVALAGAAGFGLAVAAVLALAVFAPRHERQARAALAVLPRAVAALLDALAASARLGETRRRRERMRAALRRVDRVALVVDEHAGFAGEHGAELRRRATALELAAGRAAVALLSVLRRPDAPDDARAALAAAAERTAGALRGQAVTESAAEGATAVLAAARAAHAEDRVLALALAQAGVDLDALRAPDDVRAAPPPAEEELPPPPSHPASRLPPPARQAIQGAVATGLAVLAGDAISHQRWYWAVFAAYVVFTMAATSRGEIAARAWSRVVGTAAGVAAGVGVAALVAGHPDLELVLLFVFIFGAVLMFSLSYAVAMAFLTAVLAMLYELLGRYTAGVLVVRIEETAAGAAIAALVAAFLLPRRTGDRVAEAGARVLSSVGLALAKPSLDALRALDRHTAELRALEPAVAPLGLGDDDRVPALSTLAFYARQVASHDGAAAHPAVAALARDAASLARGEAPAGGFDARALDDDPVLAVAAAGVAESLVRAARALNP